MKLKQLFYVQEKNVPAFKNFVLKKSFKYNQMWSYFEDLTIRNIVAQSKFNLDT